jgi:hypothetical protein
VELVKIYVDEDAMDSDLVTALRSRGVTVITALDAGLIEKPDEEHLAFAARNGCVVYTFNVADFYRLHGLWVKAGREHAGMILAPQQHFSVGEQLRRLLRLRAAVSSDRMRSHVEFLSNWAGDLAPDAVEAE